MINRCPNNTLPMSMLVDKDFNICFDIINGSNVLSNLRTLNKKTCCRFH